MTQIAAQTAVTRIAATQTVVIPNAAIRIAAIPSAAIPNAVRVGIRAAPIVGPAPLGVRDVEFHAAVLKLAQVVHCVARAYSKERSQSFPAVDHAFQERPQSEADPESQVVPVAARGLAVAEAQAEL